jgi:hypothetical protein
VGSVLVVVGDVGVEDSLEVNNRTQFSAPTPGGLASFRRPIFVGLDCVGGTTQISVTRVSARPT